MEDMKLPALLEPFRHKLYGLTIDPDACPTFTTNAAPTAVMPRWINVIFEVEEVELLYRRENIRF